MKPKFKIGDSIIFKGSKNRKMKFFDRVFGKKEQFKVVEHNVTARVYIVTDIWIEICYGGTQIHYNLRGTFLDGKSLECGVEERTIRAREIELERASK